MDSDFEWDAEEKFQRYLLDYMVKNNMQEAADTFRKEAGISINNPVALDAPKGFLHDWWSFFYDTYMYTEAKQQEQTAGSSSQVIPSSHLQQQIYNQPQQRIMRTVQGYNRNGVGLERTLTKDPTLVGTKKGKFPITGPGGAGINEGFDPTPLNGWPVEVLNSLVQPLTPQQQYELSAAQRKTELLTQLLACTPTGIPNASLKSIQVREQIMAQMRQNTEHQKQYDQLQQQLQLEDYANAEGSSSMEENFEIFLSHEDDNEDKRSMPFSVLKRRPTASNKNEHKGFTFEELGCLNSSNSKVLCCHYSSDGKLLASAGHEKKVFIWNTETFDFSDTWKGHSLLITDVRFRSNSTIFATSSFDRTVQIWDAARPSKSLLKLVGHAEQVISLDFHPRKEDLLCSCDCNDEIRLWNVNQSACTRTSRGATKQVRFQPLLGKLLATASGNCVNVIDVETDSLLFCLKGHAKEVLSVCWEASGKYIASVSEDSARVWSIVTGGECVYELHSNGNKFRSCTFHPGYSQLLIIGGYQSLELWDLTESNKTLTIQAHKGLISSLADSLETETVASASHDKCVKLWK